uniref:Uncharacterized protein n=1 Tax=Streptomyces sp. NBC_00093 TaxID=2975649 RepID=A0AAU1ZP72_9ACTN
MVGVVHRDAVPGAKAAAGLVRAGRQGVDGERGRGVGVGQPVDGGPLVLAQRVQEAGAGQGAQQGVAQDVGGERGAAGGFGFLLLAAPLVLQLPGTLALGVGPELVLDHGVGSGAYTPRSRRAAARCAPTPHVRPGRTPSGRRPPRPAALRTAGPVT